VRLPHEALLAVVAVLAVAAIAAMAILWPGRVELEPIDPTQEIRLVDGVLVEVEEVPTDEDDLVGLLPGATLVDIVARVEETGETVAFTMSDDTGDTFAAGQRVKLQEITGADGEVTYLVSDFRRERPMTLLAAMFLFAVVAFGRWQGARALVGLALTFGIIIGFIIPAILDGRSPVTAALVGAVLIMILTLYLSHGYNRKTTAAVVGTAFALLLTGALAVVFVGVTHLTGFTSEEARLANVEVGGLSLTGLLLAGIIIGGLGVLDDVTMSQASTVFELHRANPAATFGELLRGALNVGRDHIAATVNTLFLAYAGASLPLLILFSTGTDTIGTVVTSEIVAVEVVRTLVGSIGLIAAVPFTTALAAALVGGDPEAARAEAVLGGHSHTHSAPAGRINPERRRSGSSSRSALRGGDRVPAPAPEGAGPSAADDDDDEEWIRQLRTAYRLPEADDDGSGSPE
jgi:uncharacterized membrane protein